MKLKTLRKKIRRLEKRLREGPAKLVTLKKNLEAIEAERKFVARARAAMQHAKSPARIRKAKPRVTPMAPVKPKGAKNRNVAKKVKRKLNLSPERRAQLAAAMKARWAAKRAAAATSQPSKTAPLKRT